MGQLNASFEQVWQREIPETLCIAHLFKHKKTGAQVLYLASSDINKTFTISFKTVPSSSNGVAHILEHCVLGGSKKYPVKDPFLQLLKTSFKTFLNAMTYPDKTLYPVSSTNDKDFSNLVDVYLDCVFDPLLRVEDFKTDGWRYDFEGENLVYKGVVYNEMKGALSSPEDYLLRTGLEQLYPDTTYKHESGGDPEEIPTLSYEEFCQFHRAFYHPSNSKTFLYGKLDLNLYLEKLDAYFNRYEFRDDFASITAQKEFSASKEISLPIVAQPEKDRNACFTLAAGLINNPSSEEILALDIFSYCLFGSEASPMRKFLEEGYAESFIGGGLASFTLQPFLYFGAKGVLDANLDESVAVFNKMLDESILGLSYKNIEAAINSLEFSYRSPSSNNLGMYYAKRVFEQWNYDKDPIHEIYFEDKIKSLRAKDLPYFKELFSKYFITNPHKILIKYKPDLEFFEKKDQHEKLKLTQVFKSLPASDIAKIKTEAKDLETWKSIPNTPADLQVLPELTVQDIPQTDSPIDSVRNEIEGVSVIVTDTKIPGVVFLDLVFDVTNIAIENISYLGIYLITALKLGTKTHNYKDWALLLEGELGGFDISYNVLPIFEGFHASSGFKEQQQVIFSLKLLSSRFEIATKLLEEFLSSINFDQPEKIDQILKESRKELEEQVVESGNYFAQLKAL